MTKESINQRVLDSIDYLLTNNKLINKTTLAQNLDIGASKFSEILNGRMKAGPEIMAALSLKYNISPDYLLTGEGSILKFNDNSQEIVNKGKEIPLIPIEAFAGYAPEQYQDIPIENTYHITEFDQADFLIRVKGDSMTPRFNGGDIVACKKICELLYFQWHRIYVVYTKTQGVMIKRVEQSEKSEFIKLVSDNPSYRPFEIPKKDISDIALVMGAVTLE